MDFMAPRALAPSFNKVKSKALSIRQWAKGGMGGGMGGLDAAVFNPRDTSIQHMLGCYPAGGATWQRAHLGTWGWCGRVDLPLQG